MGTGGERTGGMVGKSRRLAERPLLNTRTNGPIGLDVRLLGPVRRVFQPLAQRGWLKGDGSMDQWSSERSERHKCQRRGTEVNTAGTNHQGSTQNCTLKASHEDTTMNDVQLYMLCCKLLLGCGCEKRQNGKPEAEDRRRDFHCGRRAKGRRRSVDP